MNTDVCHCILALFMHMSQAANEGGGENQTLTNLRWFQIVEDSITQVNVVCCSQFCLIERNEAQTFTLDFRPHVNYELVQ